MSLSDNEDEYEFTGTKANFIKRLKDMKSISEHETEWRQIAENYMNYTEFPEFEDEFEMDPNGVLYFDNKDRDALSEQTAFTRESILFDRMDRRNELKSAYEIWRTKWKNSREEITKKEKKDQRIKSLIEDKESDESSSDSDNDSDHIYTKEYHKPAAVSKRKVAGPSLADLQAAQVSCNDIVNWANRDDFDKIIKDNYVKISHESEEIPAKVVGVSKTDSYSFRNMSFTVVIEVQTIDEIPSTLTCHVCDFVDTQFDDIDFQKLKSTVEDIDNPNALKTLKTLLHKQSKKINEMRADNSEDLKERRYKYALYSNNASATLTEEVLAEQRLILKRLKEELDEEENPEDNSETLQEYERQYDRVKELREKLRKLNSFNSSTVEPSQRTNDSREKNYQATLNKMKQNLEKKTKLEEKSAESQPKIENPQAVSALLDKKLADLSSLLHSDSDSDDGDLSIL